MVKYTPLERTLMDNSESQVKTLTKSANLSKWVFQDLLSLQFSLEERTIVP
jgi:hypothetical protein